MIRLFILDFRSSSTRGRCKHGIIGAQQEGGVLPEVTFPIQTSQRLDLYL